jgi:hypothetical protein
LPLGVQELDAIQSTSVDDGHGASTARVDRAYTAFFEVGSATLVGALPGELDQQRFRNFNQSGLPCGMAVVGCTGFQPHSPESSKARQAQLVRRRTVDIIRSILK